MPRKPDPFLTDEDNPELSRDQILAMRPAAEVLPPALYDALTKAHDERQARVAQQVSLDLDPDLAARLQTYGDDWRDRANAMLRKAVGL